MENIICKHLLYHIDLHNILTALQHGFSCVTQLVVTLHDLMKYKISKEQNIVILDFSKAFDTVPHDKLLYKFRHYEMAGDILDLDICIPKLKRIKSTSGWQKF